MARNGFTPPKRSQTGFTLIETIIYLALFAIVIGGALVGVYQIIDSADRVLYKTIAQQEGNFIILKLDWLLSNVKDVGSPEQPGGIIKITDANDDVYEIGTTSNQLWIMKTAEAKEIYLNSESIEVSNLSLKREDISDPSDCPAGKYHSNIGINFTLKPKAENKSYDFKSTKFLPQCLPVD